MLRRVVLGLAGVAGAAGVGLGAVAAHVGGGANVTTASNFLLFHAAAALGLMALPHDEARWPLPAIAAALMLTGAGLFAGDLAMRQLAGAKLLWGTAPMGGSTLILGWLVVVAAAVTGHGRSERAHEP